MSLSLSRPPVGHTYYNRDNNIYIYTYSNCNCYSYCYSYSYYYTYYYTYYYRSQLYRHVQPSRSFRSVTGV